MKTVALIGLLMVGSSFQAFSMGHPHNVFAARKQLRTKPALGIVEQKNDLSVCWQHMVQATKAILSDLTVITFSRISPTRAF